MSKPTVKSKATPSSPEENSQSNSDEQQESQVSPVKSTNQGSQSVAGDRVFNLSEKEANSVSVNNVLQSAPPIDQTVTTAVTPSAIQSKPPINPFERSESPTKPAELTQLTQQAIQRGIMLVEIHKSMQETSSRFDEIINRIKITFWSILLMNWILIGIAVSLFAGAFYSALGGQFAITGALAAMGVADIITLFTFAMNRVQTSLGDQVQVQIATNGYMKQLLNFDERLSFELKPEEINSINEEIRRATLVAMEQIQNFTKIGKESAKEPWLDKFPIRYGKLDFPKEVTEGTPISVSGVITNKSDSPVPLTSIVIAVRPPGGTPTGGPFNFDFSVQPGRVVKPGESITISDQKTIEMHYLDRVTQVISPEYYDKPWCAFMTCQTSDGNWHDNPSKESFKVKKKNS